MITTFRRKIPNKFLVANYTQETEINQYIISLTKIAHDYTYILYNRHGICNISICMFLPSVHTCIRKFVGG